jgi:hypothetical protein
MLSLLIDVVVAWLLVRFVPAGTKRMLLGLLGGWLAAIAGSVLVGFAMGWPPAAMLSRLTIGLLVHPVIVGGLVGLFGWIRARGKGRPGAS